MEPVSSYINECGEVIMPNRSRQDVRENPSDQTAYGVYNYGRLIFVEYLKRGAKKAAEDWTGRSWDEIKDHIEIHKVVVRKI